MREPIRAPIAFPFYYAVYHRSVSLFFVVYTITSARYHITSSTRSRIDGPSSASIFQARPRDLSCAGSTNYRSCGLESYLVIEEN